VPWITHYADDGAEVDYSGHTTGSEILEAKRQFFAHKFDGEPLYLLCDLTNVSHFDVNPTDVDLIIKQDLDAVASHPELIETVVAPKPFQFGMARMWQMRVDAARPTAHVSRTRSEAIAWFRKHGVEIRTTAQREGRQSS
jgi:hypothetical protein